VDVQTVAVGARETVRVKRYHRNSDSVRPARPTVVSSGLSLDEVTEASARVSAAALEAALIETSSGFDLTSKQLLAMDSAGVPDRVIDLLVALSYPEKFLVQRVAQASLGGQSTYARDPFLIWPYYDGYYYGSPYFYEPFGFRGYAVVQYVPVIIGDGGGGGGNGSASGTGRVVNGQGYTRVVPRDQGPAAPAPPGRTASTSRSAPVDSSSSSGSSASGSSSSGSSSSGSSSGGSSSGGSSGGSSTGDSGSSGRTAVPR
jgi:hypothetical protein